MSTPTPRFSVLTDKDTSIGLERNSILKSLVNLVLVPILNNLPASFRKLIRKSHESANEVIVNATNHKALEVLYSHGKPHRSRSPMQRFFHYVWFHSNNSRGVRNRLRIVKRELKDLFSEKASALLPLEVMSIASGSARAVIESLKDSGAAGVVPISGIFLDKNPDAISYSKALAEEFLEGSHSLEWVNDTVGNFFKTHEPKDRFDAVEMVGLLDYFDNEKTVDTFKKIRHSLKPGGKLITANISPNSERKFVTQAIGWPMIYRSAEDLAKLLLEAGFSHDKMKVMYEPLKVHTVIVAEK